MTRRSTGLDYSSEAEYTAGDESAVDLASAAVKMSLSAGRAERAPPTVSRPFYGPRWGSLLGIRNGKAYVAGKSQARPSRMIGRSGDRRATSRKPAAAKVDAYPVLVALGETSPSSGYASIADTPAERAPSTAA
jgi:hypothetical protein